MVLSVISGPFIQVPSVKIVDKDGNMANEWKTFFSAAQQIAFNLSRAGPTTSRPTSTMQNRYIGMDFFDVTLGLKVTLKSVGPDVWVRGDGVAV